MKIGLFIVQFFRMSLDEVLDLAVKKGLEAIEIGTGNYCTQPKHCDLEELLSSKERLKEFKFKIEDRGLTISALSCHGNPLHPQVEIASRHQKVFRDTIVLAEKLGVKRVINFSGCPGDSESSMYPNWVVCPWPDDFSKVVKWQWEKKIIPYWEKEVKFAQDHGVKICIEMHPGFSVYNTETLLRLRSTVGDTIGANFDPSHLFWQGIDPVSSIRKLGNAIYHVHIKDVGIDPVNTSFNGVLDTKSYSKVNERSWVFRTIGYGHDYKTWKDIITALRMVGYDDVLSIEHEDALLSLEEGFEKAVDFLKQIVLREKPGKMWWD